jgi:hypothetical protein
MWGNRATLEGTSAGYYPKGHKGLRRERRNGNGKKRAWVEGGEKGVEPVLTF